MSTEFPAKLADLGYTEEGLEQDNPFNQQVISGRRVTDPEELAGALAQCYGTMNWYRHPMNKEMLYTDGVKLFAEMAEAYWFLDIIATELATKMRSPGWEFQHIVLVVSPDGPARITVDDGDDHPLYSRHIQFTDCPAGTWPFYMTDGVMLLPSEY